MRVLAVLALCVAFADALYIGENAARLARGLAPAKPKRLFEPSRTQFAPRGATSPLPPPPKCHNPINAHPGQTVTGTISVAVWGNSVKRAATVFYLTNGNVLTTDATRAASLKFVQPTTPNIPVTLTWPFGSDTGANLAVVVPLPVQGAGAQDPARSDLSPTSQNYGVYTHTNPTTDAGSTAAYTNGNSIGNSGFFETSIFTFDDNNGLMSTNWHNSDHSNPHTVVCVDSNTDTPRLFMTSDVTSLNGQMAVTCGLTLCFSQQGAAKSP